MHADQLAPLIALAAPGLGEGCVCVVITMATRDENVAAKLALALAEAMEREVAP